MMTNDEMVWYVQWRDLETRRLNTKTFKSESELKIKIEELRDSGQLNIRAYGPIPAYKEKLG